MNTEPKTKQTALPRTPLPWGIERTRTTNWIGPLRGGSIKIAEIVAHTDREGLTVEATAKNDANAEYIVRACNAFPDMIKALERFIGDDACYCKWDTEVNPCGWCLAESALRKARGEEG